MELWHPAAERVEPLAGNAGTYIDSPWRSVLHTTESKGYTPSRSSYYGHQSFPHFTVWLDRGRLRIAQHYPINRAARALRNAAGGTETNRLRCVQTEIGWVASQAADMPRALQDGVASILRWTADQTGHALTGPKFYGQDAGWVLASPIARQRMTPRTWFEFNGVCGHQHVPEGNDHWDPGGIDLAGLLRTTYREDDLMPALTEDQQKELFTWLGNMHHELRAERDSVREMVAKTYVGSVQTAESMDRLSGKIDKMVEAVDALKAAITDQQA